MSRIAPLRMLGCTPALTELSPAELDVAAGIRLWGLLTRMGRCAMAPLAERLGSMRAAAHFHLMLEEVMTAWPDPFCISPPCSSRLSHDEATLARMVAIASQGDRPAFDRLLSDLLPADERDRLFLSAGLVATAIAGA